MKPDGGYQNNTGNSEERISGSEAMAKRFKDTFSRKDVKVHFLGAWYVSTPVVLMHMSRHCLC